MQSVLEQDYARFEYILIDGGSSDNSVEIIRKYAEQLTYWTSEKDHGQSHAINKGFKRARGDLVAWINADDYYYPGAFQAMAEAYSQQRDAAFYWGNGAIVDEVGTVIGQHYPKESLVFDRTALIEGLNYILQPATFINRHVLDSVGLLDEQLHFGMDTDLWIRLSGKAEPMRVEATVAVNREYGQTKTASGGFARAEELRQLAECHSGKNLTVGALWYYMETLCRYVQQHPDEYGALFPHLAGSFLAAVQSQLVQHGRLQGIYPVQCLPKNGLFPKIKYLIMYTLCKLFVGIKIR